MSYLYGSVSGSAIRGWATAEPADMPCKVKKTNTTDIATSLLIDRHTQWKKDVMQLHCSIFCCGCIFGIKSVPQLNEYCSSSVRSLCTYLYQITRPVWIASLRAALVKLIQNSKAWRYSCRTDTDPVTVLNQTYCPNVSLRLIPDLLQNIHFNEAALLWAVCTSDNPSHIVTNKPVCVTLII